MLNILIIQLYNAQLVLALESWHKVNSDPSMRSPVVDEERMRPGH